MSWVFFGRHLGREMTLSRRHTEMCHGQLHHRFGYNVLSFFLTSHSDRYKANGFQVAAGSQRCTMSVFLSRKDLLTDSLFLFRG